MRSPPGTPGVRRSAAAFDRPTGIVRLWRETAPAAVRAAASADPEGYVTTQGHVLRVPDFLATLTTEAVVHHLDLTPELPDAPPPDPLAVRVAVATMDGLLSDDTVRPTGWDDHEFLLKATGRLPLTGRYGRSICDWAAKRMTAVPASAANHPRSAPSTGETRDLSADCHVHESREMQLRSDGHGVSWPISMLGNNEIRLARPRRLFVVVVVAVQKDDNVGILLD